MATAMGQGEGGWATIERSLPFKALVIAFYLGSNISLNMLNKASNQTGVECIEIVEAYTPQKPLTSWPRLAPPNMHHARKNKMKFS